MRFIYHRLAPARANPCSGNQRIPKEAPEIFSIPSRTEIEAIGILDADAQFEALTGINPVCYKGHTPPITVECFAENREAALAGAAPSEMKNPRSQEGVSIA